MIRSVAKTLWLVPALLVAVPSGAAAQEADGSGMLGIGYSTNAPQMLLGGTVWGLIPGLGGWGLYVDAKQGVSDPTDDEVLRGETPAEVEQQFPLDDEFNTEEYWRGFNVGIVRELTEELIVYVGGGYAEKTVYRHYFDQSETRGFLGWYWVEDPDATGATANVLGGALLRVGPAVRFQFGGELNPGGFTVGISYVFGGR